MKLIKYIILLSTVHIFNLTASEEVPRDVAMFIKWINADFDKSYGKIKDLAETDKYSIDHEKNWIISSKGQGSITFNPNAIWKRLEDHLKMYVTKDKITKKITIADILPLRQFLDDRLLLFDLLNNKAQIDKDDLKLFKDTEEIDKILDLLLQKYVRVQKSATTSKLKRYRIQVLIYYLQKIKAAYEKLADYADLILSKKIKADTEKKASLKFLGS